MVSSTVNQNSFKDGGVKIWDLIHENRKMTNLLRRTDDKVMSSALHPTKELLAFGTCEGRVGTVSAGNTSKAPVLLTQKFKSEIRHIKWRPDETGNGAAEML